MKTEQTPEKAGRRSSKPPAATPPPPRRYKSSEPEPAEGSHTEGALPSVDDKKTPIKEEPGETRRSKLLVLDIREKTIIRGIYLPIYIYQNRIFFCFSVRNVNVAGS